MANRRQRGFTMIEILLVLALSFIGLLGLLSLQVVAVRANVQSRSITEATALAQDKLETLRRIPVLSLTGSTEAAIDAQGNAVPTAMAYAAYQRKTLVTPGASTTVVKVTVSWLDRRGNPHAVTVQTVRAM